MKLVSQAIYLVENVFVKRKHMFPCVALNGEYKALNAFHQIFTEFYLELSGRKKMRWFLENNFQTTLFNFSPYTARNCKYLLILFYCKLFRWEFRLCNSAAELPTNDNCLSKLQFWPQQIYTLKDKYLFWPQQIYIYIR